MHVVTKHIVRITQKKHIVTKILSTKHKVKNGAKNTYSEKQIVKTCHKKFAFEFYPQYNLHYLIKVPEPKAKKTSEKKKPAPQKNYGKRTRPADQQQTLILLAGLAFIFFIFVIVSLIFL